MKKILVTGGARGIGKAIVDELAGAGHKVVATYHASKPSNGKVDYRKVNLEDREELDAFIDQVAKEEPIDVLINNAGIYLGKVFEKMTKEEMFEQIDLNFAAPSRLMHGLLPALKKSKTPLIINISSQAAHPIMPGEAMYSAVKSALSTLSSILRIELNPKRVRLTTIEPWGVNTYGIPEPSNMILPKELAQVIKYVVEAPDHIQFDTINLSHVKQWRANYPEWIEKK